MGSIEGQTADITGAMWSVIYNCEPKKTVEVNGRRLEVVDQTASDQERALDHRTIS